MDRNEGSFIRLWLDNRKVETLTRIAISERQSIEVILNRFIDLGMGLAAENSKDEQIKSFVREAVNDVIQPQINRLAKISTRVSSIDAATFFLLTYVGRLMSPPDDQPQIDVVVENARQLGFEFSKSKRDFNMDEFIQKGLEQLKDNNATIHESATA